MRTGSVVPMVVLGSGVLFAVLGGGLLIAGQTLLGGIFVAVGVSDAIMALVFRSRLERGASAAGKAAPPPGQAPEGADPSYNPYARED